MSEARFVLPFRRLESRIDDSIVIGYYGRGAGKSVRDQSMTKKQQRTLDGIFADPVRGNIDWHDVESLLLALGAELTEGRGSRLRVALNDVREVFHRPHPRNEAGKPMVRELRRFLLAAGIRPSQQEDDE
jgi:hypothetical protein